MNLLFCLQADVSRYNLEEARRGSLAAFPLKKQIPSEEMAEAGFWYTGIKYIYFIIPDHSQRAGFIIPDHSQKAGFITPDQSKSRIHNT